MSAKRAKPRWIPMLWVPSAPVLAHGGPHLDEKTIEAIFQLADRFYLGFVTNLPLIAGVLAGVLLPLVVIRIFRRRLR
ncbi:MAG: hypothetical protein N3A55_07440 [Methylohalobius sp.]|nr:hypothetical protein [Methylohalobius sp.]